jgi:hypothetical protein
MTVFLSAWRDNLSLDDNLKANNELFNLLIDLGLQFEQIVGKFKGKHELSFKVKTNSEISTKNLLTIAKQFNQDSVMITSGLDYWRIAYLLEFNGGDIVKTELGALKFSTIKPIECDYSFIPSKGFYLSII